MRLSAAPGGQNPVFLFTDIEGSTARWERDPIAMNLAVSRHDTVLRGVMIRHDGHIFKTLGDSFCVAFPTAEQAIEAALGAQRALSCEEFPGVGGIAVRMAIHSGAAEIRDGDYFGQPVNRVARLLSTAHGGQIVVSGVVTDLVQARLPARVSLRDMGQHRLKDLTNPEQIYQLIAPDLRSEFPPLRSLSATPNNLPQQVSTFIGRDAELHELRGLVDRNRLVTLVGSGGMGKTRIALQLGADQLGRFRDGVWLLELAPLADGHLVAETAAALFGIVTQGEWPKPETIATYLRDREMLLILDNCEHVVAEAATLAAAILRLCPGVTLLASSREGLAVAGECIYRMPSLGFPDRPDGITAEAALEYGAVRLFVDRAQAAVSGFVLTDETAPAVSEICRRLDGIALALELAAPRIRMLTPQGLLARLKDRFRLLTGGDRTALPRQQTLRALIDWSYVLLSRNEQMLLQRLAVFGGSFSIESATEVAGGEPIEEWEMFDLIASLVDKSLVMPQPTTSGESRYRLLESTRDYACEKLVASGDTARRQILAEHVERIFRQASREWQNTSSESWLTRYEPELENLRASLDWAFGPEGDALLGARIVACASQLLLELSLIPELRQAGETALAAASGRMPPEIEAAILLFSIIRGSFGSGRSEAMAERAVTLLRGAGDPEQLGRGLRLLGMALARPPTLEIAEARLREGEAMLRGRPRSKEFGHVLGNLAVVRQIVGDTTGAMALVEESLSIARRLGDRYGIEIQALSLAEFEFLQGHALVAIERAREAEAACRRSGNRRILLYVLGNLAAYCVAADRIGEAREAASEVIRLARAMGAEPEPMIWAIEHLALVAALSGDPILAARLIGHGNFWYHAEGKARQTTEQASFDRTTGLLDTLLAPAERQRHEAEGSAWPTDEAATAALTVAAVIATPSIIELNAA